jgi:6-phosphofructokinase 1
MDRARASRLSLKCIAWIEKHAWDYKPIPIRKRTPIKATAAVIAIEGSSVRFTPVEEMVEHADMNNRRGSHTWWEGYKELAEVMGSKNYFASKLARNL